MLGLEPVGGKLPEMVQVTHLARRDGKGELVHLVNHSGSLWCELFCAAVLSDLSVEIGCAKKPRSVKSLVTGAAAEHAWAAGKLTIKVPRLELFEAFKIEG